MNDEREEPRRYENTDTALCQSAVCAVRCALLCTARTAAAGALLHKLQICTCTAYYRYSNRILETGFSLIILSAEISSRWPYSH